MRLQAQAAVPWSTWRQLGWALTPLPPEGFRASDGPEAGSEAGAGSVLARQKPLDSRESVSSWW